MAFKSTGSYQQPLAGSKSRTSMYLLTGPGSSTASHGIWNVVRLTEAVSSRSERLGSKA